MNETTETNEGVIFSLFLPKMTFRADISSATISSKGMVFILDNESRAGLQGSAGEIDQLSLQLALGLLMADFNRSVQTVG